LVADLLGSAAVSERMVRVNLLLPPSLLKSAIELRDELGEESLSVALRLLIGRRWTSRDVERWRRRLDAEVVLTRAEVAERDRARRRVQQAARRARRAGS